MALKQNSVKVFLSSRIVFMNGFRGNKNSVFQFSFFNSTLIRVSATFNPTGNSQFVFSVNAKDVFVVGFRFVFSFDDQFDIIRAGIRTTSASLFQSKIGIASKNFSFCMKICIQDYFAKINFCILKFSINFLQKNQ